MKRTWIAVLLAAVLLSAWMIPAYAVDEDLRDDWLVTFDGSKMESNFSSGEISDRVSGMQPGDQVTIRLALKNTSSVPTDWYMTNSVLKSLEDSKSQAGGGAYTYVLTYVDRTGTANVLYDSDSVGGEKNEEAGVGLHEATDSLDEYFYLDTLAAGQAGEITLLVALDGETQGNVYQNTLAELNMNFAVELASTTTSPAPSAPGDKPAGSVNTGDDSNVILWVVMMVASAAVFVGLLVAGRKNRKEGRNHHE